MTDSHSGILEKEAQENQMYVLPMPFLVNGDLHLEGASFTGSFGKALMWQLRSHRRRT